MSQNNNTASGSEGVGFFGFLFFIFLVLKLTGFIDWSWWWVTAPLWGPALSLLILLVIILIVGLTLRALRLRRERLAREARAARREHDR